MKQVALITGGTSDIGLGLAEAFMSQGDAVAVCGRSEAAVDTPMNANVTGKKMSPAEVAAVTLKALARPQSTGTSSKHWHVLKALARRQPMALPGQTKLLPMMLRIAPNTIERMVAAIRRYCERLTARSVSR